MVPIEFGSAQSWSVTTGAIKFLNPAVHTGIDRTRYREEIIRTALSVSVPSSDPLGTLPYKFHKAPASWRVRTRFPAHLL